MQKIFNTLFRLVSQNLKHNTPIIFDRHGKGAKKSTSNDVNRH